LGVAIIMGCVALIRLCAERYNRTHPDRRRESVYDHSEFSILKSTMDAMDRIAHGDFNVLIPVRENDPFGAVADSVNEMARGLSSMEKLRQDFISNVSHEIQSPLTSIGGFAALLKSGDLDESQRTHYLDIIETESRRLSNLSANLLKLSALESDVTPITPREYRLDKQLENAVLVLEPQWTDKNLTPTLDLSKITFTGDEELLSQVWINLLHNAVKFTPEGGAFGVTLRREDGGDVTCRVYDSGIGIDAQDRVHIFERFYKADSSRDRALGGNGLGLSLVKKIVELHGGTIDVESEPGHGAAFTVRLPAPKV
jgi:signal transduction histidine kinase